MIKNLMKYLTKAWLCFKGGYICASNKENSSYLKENVFEPIYKINDTPADELKHFTKCADIDSFHTLSVQVFKYYDSSIIIQLFKAVYLPSYLCLILEWYTDYRGIFLTLFGIDCIIFTVYSLLKILSILSWALFIFNTKNKYIRVYLVSDTDKLFFMLGWLCYSILELVISISPLILRFSMVYVMFYKGFFIEFIKKRLNVEINTELDKRLGDLDTSPNLNRPLSSPIFKITDGRLTMSPDGHKIVLLSVVVGSVLYSIISS